MSTAILQLGGPWKHMELALNGFLYEPLSNPVLSSTLTKVGMTI